MTRTGLILDIFALRARTHEGELQVELAQLKHLSTRLIRGFTGNLEQQKGGIGLRGPGESQLETDRRLIRYALPSSRKNWSRFSKPVCKAAPRVKKQRFQPFHWWDIPMQENQPYLTSWQK